VGSTWEPRGRHVVGGHVAGGRKGVTWGPCGGHVGVTWGPRGGHVVGVQEVRSHVVGDAIGR